MKRLCALFSGHVQGIGFRYTVCSLARDFHVSGTVRNLPDGRVELVAEGEEPELARFLGAVLSSELKAYIRDTATSWSCPRGEFEDFRIGF